jgi:hypothetical protein
MFIYHYLWLQQHKIPYSFWYVKWGMLLCLFQPTVFPSRNKHALVDAYYFIPCITDELMNERDKYKAIADEMDQTFADLAGY